MKGFLIVEAVAASFATFILIPPNDTFVANRASSLANGRIGILNAGLSNVHTSGHVGSHDIAPSLVEHRCRNTGLGSAKRFPVPIEGVHG